MSDGPRTAAGLPGGDVRLSGVMVALVVPSSTGGIGRHVVGLVGGLVDRGADVTVLGPADTGRLFGFEVAGARFVPVAIPAEPGPRDLRALGRLLNATAGADVVHPHGLRAGLLCALARRLPSAGSTPLVTSWHNPPPPGRRARLLAAVLARSADVTLAASADLADTARRLGGRDVRFAPVAAPPSTPVPVDATAVRAALGAASRPLVVAVGRLHPQKGYDTLVAASLLWAARRPTPLTVVAGSGPLERSLTDLIAGTGAPVRLLGRRGEVADLLAAADVVVLPSRWEARSLVAQEALRAGRPLVASAVGGLPELVGDAAVLVPPGDAAALARAVVDLLDDPAAAEALAARGPARARLWPDEADTVAQVAATYAELLGRP